MSSHHQEDRCGSYVLSEAIAINLKDSHSVAIKAIGLPSLPPPNLPLPAIPTTKSQIPSNNNRLQSIPNSPPTDRSQNSIHTNLKRAPISKVSQAPAPAEKVVSMAPTAVRPTKAEMRCLELCHKTTQSIDLTAVHILEYLTTTPNSPPSFTQLSHDFLTTCELLYTIESGLAYFKTPNPAMQPPAELLGELETKFRVTQADFNMLNIMLQKMNSPKKGFSKSWGKMFNDTEGEIRKISAALRRTKESLKMSSLVFSWTLNPNGEKEDLLKLHGFGYKGLAAALDRLEPEKEKVSAKEVTNAVPPLQTQQIQPAKVEAYVPVARTNVQTGSPYNEMHAQQGFPHPHHSQQSHVQNQLHLSPQGDWLSRSSSLPRQDSIGHASGGHEYPHHARSHFAPSSDFQHSILHSPTSSPSSIDPYSPFEAPSHMDDAQSILSRTDPSILHEDFSGLDLDPTKVVRHNVDPSSMPRLYPPLSADGESLNMKGSLISAIRGKNYRAVEQLLQRGVSTAAAPNMHPLKEAILAQDDESTRLLLLLGADPNEAGRDGVTPLLACIEKSSLAGASMLLRYGANPNMGAGHGEDFESPLAAAVKANMITMSQLLLEYNGDANHQTTDGTPLLTTAIQKKTPKKFIELLLAYGAKPNAKSRQGKVALFEAISLGRADITLTLIEAGADVNLPGPKHMFWPSIHYPACLAILLSHGADHKKAPGIMEQAVGTNNIEVVRMLLKAGVSPDTKKDGTYTPLCSAIRDDRPELVKLLLSNGADPNVPAAEYPAFKCVTHNRVHFLPMLVAAGVALNKPKGILETAVSFNNVEALKWLLDQGVSPNDKSPKGMTPLTTAIRENRIDLVELLLTRGADPHVRGQDWPILMAVANPPILERLLTVIKEPQAFKGIVERAVHADQLESVEMLLAAGVSVEDKNGGVFSPLTTAIRENHREIVRYLIDEGGADVNAPGEHLPVVKALRTFRGDETEILEWLLEKGADPNKMYRGWNGMMQAVENGNESVLKMLARRSGVDLEVRDDMGHTVVEMAASRGWDDAVQILIEGDLGVTLRSKT